MKALCFRPLQSVSEIASTIDRSIPSATKILNELATEGLVDTVGLGPSTGGRRALQYQLQVNQLPLILSVAIDQYYSSVALLNFDHSYFSPVKTIKNALTDPLAYDKLVSLITEVKAIAGSRRIFAIGLTSPGFVNADQGINASYPPGNPFHNIKKQLEKTFGIQTLLENDSAAIAIAEKRFGRNRESKDILVVNLNWGIGLGMIIDGKLFRGHSGFAGEFSHIPLSDKGTLCSCGKRGCLEVEASLLSAVSYATERLANGEPSLLAEAYTHRGYITGECIIDAAKRGDQLALSAVDQIAYAIGKGLATLIHIINPEHIILSGRGARLGDILPGTIQTSLRKYTIERLRMQTQFSMSEIENPQILGGACLAIENADFQSL
ncbi:ROK family transcriptional regulator [Sphingobacterium sp. lm-10]|uniref:ROK family transcriptional regulator n=1 Tax=Sphingobacterium sp. lm-10 TaxID=2944904 RepID=UPI0020215D40|nr:ROK family transcriptional regulator [Sphingobacterium sp. lm-10]MCL7987837.1 ROK family transcriptional regulator [Sphingobacterium sp. lm-10]